MALKEKQTSLMANNNATYKTVEGVTYFKLKSEFEGDYTKHCGLLGEEIDENFYFLRGYDIESFEFDDKKNLIIQRVDKDYPPIVINMEDTIEHPTFEFDKKNGEITVTYPDGTIKVMGGFFVEGRDVRIATDSTFNGNGTMYNPLRLSPTETTGTFAPADEYFDLTDGNTELEGKGKGYRVVTKEKIDNFGCLYPFSAVKKIQDKLTETGSQWRVPSKEDWDELLNALECPEDRNHSAITCTWLGKVAGAGLKSANLWKEYSNLLTEDPTNGQDVRGLTIYPVGITPDRNEILNDNNHDAEGFSQIAGMWTSTINDEGNAYVKIFGYNSAKVDQDTYGEGARMSIRLIKEYAYDNFNEIENILGFPYPTELVYGIHDDYPYAKIWTKINLYSDAESLDGIRSEEWSAVTDSDKGVKIIYFINEWDGEEWHKKPMENGDSIVIIDREDKPYHEWRIIEGELIDTSEALVEEFNKDFAEVREDIAELSATTKELVQFSGWVVETINEFSAATTDADMVLSGSIETEIARALEAESFLSGAVDTERDERIASDAFLQTQITENIAKIVPVTENLGANVRDEYVLKNAKGEELGSHIKIYKDSALVGAEVNYKGAIAVSQKEDGTFEFIYGADTDKEVEYLYLIYRNENGGLSLVALDFENFLMENEEGLGIKIADHKIAIKIKDGEKYLTSTEDGLQTIAIDEAIKEAVLGSVLRIKKVEPTASNIKSRYELQDANGQLIGDPIEMPIESALVGVKQGHVGDAIDSSNGNYITFGEGDTTMNFVYRLEDGSYELAQVVVSEYFTDSHFGRGLNNQDGTVSLLEGDGNEYLVIGEDTIAVVGVNNAIATAKAESETLINKKYESATGYTDQRYNESIAHTNTRVDDVVSSVDSLTNTIDTAINGLNDTLTAATASMGETVNSAVDGMNATVNSAVDGMNATVNSAVEGFNTLLTESINGVNNSLDTEITNRENADNVLDGKILGNTTAISSLQSDHVAFSGSIISYVDNKVSEAADSTELKAKEYADNLNAVMSERVNALEGDNHTHTNKVELDKIAEGDKAKWDDAVSRLDNFLIGNGVDEVIDTLQDIKDWMNGEGVVATELTEAIAAETKLRSDADAALGTRITALEGINHDAYKEADNTLSGNILTYVNNEDAKVISAITKNEAAITVLNADKKTEGSVLYRIENEFEKSLITDGVPVTAVSPEEANKVHSLIRQITVNGEMRYYVVSDATEMFYVKPRATETAPIEAVNLNDYITSLETRVAVLEEKLSGFAGDMEQTIKGLIKSYLVGTENEIKIAETDDKLKIGFDDNAIFGEI